MRSMLLALLALSPAAVAETNPSVADAAQAVATRHEGARVEVRRTLAAQYDFTDAPELTVEDAERLLAPHRARLVEVKATSRWYAGPTPTSQDGGFEHGALLGGLLVADPEFRPVMGATAEVGANRRWHKEQRSNYKVAFDDAGRVTDALFWHYQLYEGRGTTETGTDVLVRYVDGVPLHVFVSEVDPRGHSGPSEALLSLHWSDDGRLARVNAVRLTKAGSWSDDDDPGPWPSARTWTGRG